MEVSSTQFFSSPPTSLTFIQAYNIINSLTETKLTVAVPWFHTIYVAIIVGMFCNINQDGLERCESLVTEFLIVIQCIYFLSNIFIWWMYVKKAQMRGRMKRISRSLIMQVFINRVDLIIASIGTCILVNKQDCMQNASHSIKLLQAIVVIEYATAIYFLNSLSAFIIYAFIGRRNPTYFWTTYRKIVLRRITENNQSMISLILQENTVKLRQQDLNGNRNSQQAISSDQQQSNNAQQITILNQAPEQNNQSLQNLPAFNNYVQSDRELIQDANQNIISADQKDWSDPCQICLFSFEVDEEVTTFPCQGKHKYHYQCILEWTSQNPICPTCRSSLVQTHQALLLN